MASSGSPANDTWQRWHDELELAKKAKGYEQWQTRAKKIVKRYRDERGDEGRSDGMQDVAEGAKFNILWSNVQTLLPALFSKSPKPVVERRYLDRDDVGRTASVILERALLYELDNGFYQSSVRKAVLDRLLPGRGVVWVRYEPHFTAMPQKTQVDPNEKAEPETPGTDQSEEAKPAEEPQEQVAYECTPVDYIDWQDFGTSANRTWEEVWYIWKRVYMTRSEMKKRGFKAWDKVPLDYSPQKDQKSSVGAIPETGKSTDDQKRAKIIELWCKSERKVYWFAEGWQDEILDEQDDPLKLDGFWPTPKPLFATLTNDSLIPVPDYKEYEDQALELDDLTTRISNVTKAIKVAGVYDGSVDELKRMFEEGFENQLVPSDNMAEFMQKAGANGMGHIWLLPIKDMADVLMRLFEARNEVKQSLYEITGISDIIRGAATQGGAKTATEQRIKGQFASMRLNDMQGEVARFCRDVLRLMGEIISEHYDPMTLYLVSGYEQYAKEQWPPEPVPQQPQQPPNPMLGHNGGPPMGPQPIPPQGASPMPPQGGPPPAPGAPGPGVLPPGAGQQPIMLPPDPVQVARQKAADMFKQAIGLLRNDKLRGFRIDIETDSLIEPDQQAMQQARTELLGAISQFLPEAIQAGMAMPELKPLLARLLMFFLRGFKASRDIEGAFEQFVDDMTKEAANPQPKPPSPEQIKAEAELQKQQAEMQRQQHQAAIDQQNAQMQAGLDQKAAELRMQELQLKEQIAAADHQRKLQLMAAEAQIEDRLAAVEAAGQQHAAILDGIAREHQHGLTLEAQAAKADAARANGAGA